ncbi:hypothetical protein [Variovorax gossypii]
MAAPTGMGLDPELARDFWFGQEEPWNAEQDIQSRLAKLAYIHMAAAIFHVGIPLFMFAIIFEIIRTPQGAAFQLSEFSMYAVGGITVITMALGLLIALFEWRKIIRQH